jgi:hypothetical protein
MQATTEDRPTMRSVSTLAQLMSQKFPDQEYIINRILPDSSITILSGTSRSFKTYVLLHAALAIASGTPFLGQFETSQSSVLIIDEENGDRLLQKRLKQLNAPADLPIYFTHGFQLDEANLNATITRCKEDGVRLVIIDSLIRIHASDENSSRDMAQVFRLLRRFTENDIAVLVTQHNRKQVAFSGDAGNEMRGSTDILAAVDSHIGVTRKEKWYLYFNQTKQRFDVELDPFEVKVAAEETSFTFEYLGEVQSSFDKAETLRRTATELLSEYPQLSKKELQEKLIEAGVPTNEHTLKAALALWVAEGLLDPPQRGKGNTKLYSLKAEVAV